MENTMLKEERKALKKAIAQMKGIIETLQTIQTIQIIVC